MLSTRIHKYLNTETHQKTLKEAAERKAYQLAIDEALKEWENTELGMYFKNRINADRQAALEALAKIAPTEVDKIRILQNKVEVINSIQRYIAEIQMIAKTRPQG